MSITTLVFLLSLAVLDVHGQGPEYEALRTKFEDKYETQEFRYKALQSEYEALKAESAQTRQMMEGYFGQQEIANRKQEQEIAKLQVHSDTFALIGRVE